MKYIKALITLYTFLFATAIIQSCCEEKLHITSRAHMAAWEIGNTSNEVTEIKGPFILGAFFADEHSSVLKFSLITATYANTCKKTRMNKIEASSIEISINKAFLFKGDSVSAGTNILGLKNSGVEIKSVENGDVELLFSETFFSGSKLHNGDCLFQFKGNTDDGRNLRSQMLLKVAL